MKWKEKLIGATLTLVITVLGGVLVYYFTKEKHEKFSEILSYQIDKQVSFKGDKNQLSIGSLKFANIGNKPAENVQIKFHVPTAKIIEFKVSSKNGADISKILSEKKETVKLNIKSLVPEEIISVTYLLNQPDEIDFKIRSDDSIGNEGAIYKIDKKPQSILNDFVGNYLPFLMFALVLYSYLIYFSIKRKLKKLGKFPLISRGESRNNTAFALLHSGATQEAIDILERNILRHNSGSHSLSNYASALAVIGEKEKAKIFIKAAKLVARTSHEKAVVNFNSSIIQYNLGEHEEAQTSLEEALKQSNSEIEFYIKNSVIMDEILKVIEKNE